MDKIKRDSLDWRKICERFHGRLNIEMLNQEDDIFPQEEWGKKEENG